MKHVCLSELQEKSKELYEWFTEKCGFYDFIMIDLYGVSINQRVGFVPNSHVNDDEVKLLDVAENQKDGPTEKGVAKWAAIKSGILSPNDAENNEKFDRFWELCKKYSFLSGD